VNFSHLETIHSQTKKEIANAPYYQDCAYVESMILLEGLEYSLHYALGIVRSYMRLAEWGGLYELLISRVKDITSQYGFESGFRHELRRTKEIRERTVKRLMYIAYYVRHEKALYGLPQDEIGLTNHGKIVRFLGQLTGFRHRLNYAPLTTNQFNALLRAEHRLGIHWHDLPPSENGFAPRKDEERWKFDL